MADVTMTLEEYEALRRLITSERESEGAVEEARVTKRTRRKDPKMSKALQMANKKLRTVKGLLRKGKTQGDVMRLAHKLKKNL
jgi:HPt (histidine-containing phosphotransfer) domain-containing protein